PCFFREFIQKAHAIGGTELFNNGTDFTWRPRLQQHVRVVVRKMRNQAGSEFCGKLAKEQLLLLKSKTEKQIAGDARLELLEVQGSIRGILPQHLAKLFCGFSSHDHVLWKVHRRQCDGRDTIIASIGRRRTSGATLCNLKVNRKTSGSPTILPQLSM